MKSESSRTEKKGGTMSRRDLLKRIACGGLALTGAAGALAACAPNVTEDEATTEDEAPSYSLPTEDGRWL